MQRVSFWFEARAGGMLDGMVLEGIGGRVTTDMVPGGGSVDGKGSPDHGPGSHPAHVAGRDRMRQAR